MTGLSAVSPSMRRIRGERAGLASRAPTQAWRFLIAMPIALQRAQGKIPRRAVLYCNVALLE
jgi:hypothetical protein